MRRLRPNLQHRILYSLFLANSHISNSDDLLAPFTRRRRCILHVFSNARCCRRHREVFPVSIFHRRRRRRRPLLLSFAAHSALPHEPDQMHVARVAPFRRRNRRSIDILRGSNHFVRRFRKPHRFFSSSVVVRRVVVSASPRRRRGKVMLTHRLLSVLARSFRGLPGKPALVSRVTTSRTQTAAPPVVVPVLRSRVDQDGRDGAPRVPVHADVDLSVKKVPNRIGAKKGQKELFPADNTIRRTNEGRRRRRRRRRPLRMEQLLVPLLSLLLVVSSSRRGGRGRGRGA